MTRPAIRTALTEAHPAAALLDRGLVLPAPSQVYVDRTVDLDRLQPGAVLGPGVRLCGASTFVGSGAVIGSEGPATAVDCAIDGDVEFCSGYAEGAVLFRGAKLGGSAHVRPATILEEGATTAHAVGLKQSLLMSYVTFGSLINACDLLVSGGTSKDDHSEVGSGFIHFNFTPWGERGDKATPSLIGNVHEGVFLDRRRVFVGGLSGMVGPGSVGFGAMTVAGQVIRREVGPGRLSGAAALSVDREMPGAAALNRGKLRANVEYVGQLCALRRWYVDVRLARRSAHPGPDDVRAEVLEAGVRALDAMIRERLVRLDQYWPRNDLEIDRFVSEAGRPDATQDQPAPRWLDHRPDLPHLDWVRSLDRGLVERGVAWLRSIGAGVATRLEAHFDAAR